MADARASAILRLPPSAVTGFFVLYFLAELFAETLPLDEVAFLVSYSLSVLCIVGTTVWAWAVYKVTYSQPARGIWIVAAVIYALLTLAILVAALVPSYRVSIPFATASQLITVAAVAAFLGCAWTAARSLCLSEQKKPRTSALIGTFLLIVYLVIGVWVLAPRVRSHITT